MTTGDNLRNAIINGDLVAVDNILRENIHNTPDAYEWLCILLDDMLDAPATFEVGR